MSVCPATAEFSDELTLVDVDALLTVCGKQENGGVDGTRAKRRAGAPLSCVSRAATTRGFGPHASSGGRTPVATRIRLSRFLAQHAGQRVDLDVEFLVGSRVVGFRVVV